MYDVIVIGGGAAGMMAAVFCAKGGSNTLLIEKNEKLGKKLYITGKGRCNVTSSCDEDKLLDGIVSNPKFLYSAFSQFSNKDMIEFLNANGLETVAEQGERIFPKSGKSSDVIKLFSNLLNKCNVEIMLNTEVKNICVKDGEIWGVVINNNQTLQSKNVIIATGGASYPLTGSTGDGYIFAKNTGHNIIKPYPALVPMEVEQKSLYDLAGLSLKNVEAALYIKNKKVAEKFGEMLFTHDGLSGPIILNLSTLISEYKDVRIDIDLKPALDFEKLDSRILRDFSKFANKDVSNALVELLPSRLIAPVLKLAAIKQDKKVNQISAEERGRLIKILKAMPFYIKNCKGFDEAIITGGGVSIKDIKPSSMESRLVKGLYFAGEVIDVHAITGGYNLQTAFSTAYLAAKSIIKAD
ncbi:MAG: NAD(P)/FAD-dependent oxidoreductase [Eubacteriaceae bacterium]|nr:NAD(P)/FAD-dependent oxidoreductase [Eubacteriaceae bacterium]